jgi:hypothetical protein
VEWANGLLKHHLPKLAKETHLPWPKLLPLALFPFESLYGRPFLTNDLILDSETARLTSHITQLAKFQ